MVPISSAALKLISFCFPKLSTSITSIGDNKKEVIFNNQENNIIIFREMKDDGIITVDNEGADVVESVTILDMEGLYFLKEGKQTIVLPSEGSMIYVYSDDEELDLIGFAELIEKR